jgi:tRNA dimethylallyltransferase
MSAPDRDRRPPVVVVTGPTSAGKTTLAIALARRFDGEIVNCDSMQVYRGMDIGTAKPGPQARAAVPHHVLDVVDPDEDYNAARYVKDAREAAERIHGRRRTVFLTGGTGLYIRAFLEGLADAGGADPELREALEREHAAALAAGDPSRLHERLAERDPSAAAKIHPHDLRRIVRALEIEAGRGRRASAVRGAHAFADRPYRALHLAVDPGRDELVRRIDAHCQEMIDQGLLQEVRALRDRGYGPELRPMQAIGYRHIWPVVRGDDTLSNALEAMRHDTRRYARRQRTWLRKLADVVWVARDDVEGIAARIEAFLGEGEGYST